MIHYFDCVFAHQCLEEISDFWSVYIPQSVMVSALALWQESSISAKKHFLIYFLVSLFARPCTPPPTPPPPHHQHVHVASRAQSKEIQT